ncbi:MAG TPA: hypothetical protein PKK43_11040 [Spirochaetota bacterium]|nr:hypothetical protein [Spirochaetota bacterium]
MTTQRKILITGIMAVILIPAVLSSCGKSIDDAKNFEPNQPPVIDSNSLRVTLDTGDSIPDSVRTNLVSGMTFKVWIKASDPDNGTLSYKFTSPNATFADSVVESDGSVSAVLVTKDVTTLTKDVSITAIVTDNKKASVQQSIQIGSGKSGPQITLAVDSTKYLNDKGHAIITFSVNCNGFFQVLYVADGDPVPASSDGSPYFRYNTSKGDETVTIGGGSYALASNLKLPAAGPNIDKKYDVYIIFSDSINPDEVKKVDVTLDNTPPTIVFKSNGTVVSDGERVKSEDPITAEGSDSAAIAEITLDETPANSSMLRTSKYSSSVSNGILTVSPQSNFSLGSKTMAVNATDTAGNTANVTRTLSVYTLDMYVSATTGSDTLNQGFKDEPVNTISKGITTVISDATTQIPSNQTATIHVTEGTYSNGLSSNLISKDLNGRSLIMLGGYNTSFSQRNRTLYETKLMHTYPSGSMCSSVIYLSNGGSNNKIDGFTLINNPSSKNIYASACIYLDNITNVIISNNIIM